MRLHSKEKNKATQAIQIVYSLDQDNEKRETAGLTDAMEKLDVKGLIITMDQEDTITLRKQD